MESKQFGVDYIVAPMVETDYALSKYILAKNSVYSEFEQEHTDFLINNIKSNIEIIKKTD